MDYVFDSYTPTADHASDRWATTARGWLTVDEVMRGNYLDYPGRSVHAVIFNTAVNERTGSPIHSHYRYSEHHSVEDAQAWMVAEITGQLPRSSHHDGSRTAPRTHTGIPSFVAVKQPQGRKST
jgi:hypothetical protein